MLSWCFDRATEHTCLTVQFLQNRKRLPRHPPIPVKPYNGRRQLYRTACTTIWQEELADLASKICTQEVKRPLCSTFTAIRESERKQLIQMPL